MNRKFNFALLVVCILLSFSASSKKYSITDFGAKNDGKTLNTQAIQNAIDKASKNGGGVVTIPAGTFLSGGIELKNNVELHLEKGAVLLGSTNPNHYKKVGTHRRALVMVFGRDNVSISGTGTINGQGRALALNIDSLHHAGIDIDDNYSYRRMRPNENKRMELVNFVKCTNVKVTGISMKNASCWTNTYDQCENVIIDNVTLESRAYWNNDGFDIIDSKKVRLTNCNVNTADDGICFKSHDTERYSDDIYVGNCTVRSSASAVKFGTGSHGGFKNITIENIKVYDTFRSAIAIETVDGGNIENITVSNITAVNTGNAIFIRLGHRNGEQPGYLKNVHLKNIKVQVPFGRPDIDYDMRGPEVNNFHNPYPASIVGIPGQYIENVTLENIEISYPGRASKGMAYVPLTRLNDIMEKEGAYPEFSMFRELPSWAFYVRHAKGIHFKNIVLQLENDDFRPAFVFDDVDGVDLNQIRINGDSKSTYYVLKDAKNITTEDSMQNQIMEVK